jgi:hypothetical protein
MSSNGHSNDSDPRRRKLDELFADEPFLSPTMKARRLHEKLQKMEEQEDGATVDLPTEAYVMRPPIRRVQASEFDSGSGRLSAPTTTVSLSQAAEFYRAESAVSSSIDPACADSLIRFRDQVLKTWLEGLPERGA